MSIEIKIFHPTICKIRDLSPEDILDIVQEVTGVDKEVIVSKLHHRYITDVRAIYGAVLAETGMKYKDVAHHIGWKDHSSVIHAVKLVSSVKELSHLKYLINSKIV